MRDFSLAHFSVKKAYFILFIVLNIACKQNNNNKVKVLNIEQSNFITDSILKNKIIDFINVNALDSNYKQVYLISFNLKNKDTLLTISKTFMPKIHNKKMEYKGGNYINYSPILIIDLIPAIGNNYYDSKYLNDSIINKYRSIEHPTFFRKIMKSEKYLIKNRNWQQLFEN
ncbi:hypothetical protein [Tenacibaculum ovolyticum]|uniref:hypothetical protein n=1 Tax=Tenacibaculum ovolyticum TaxID=104270 RepID=UPI0003FA5AB6|nr:hypothetical protein [Tenacibaculum ovolyticum]